MLLFSLENKHRGNGFIVLVYVNLKYKNRESTKCIYINEFIFETN
jgi:hypothetical protein